MSGKFRITGAILSLSILLVACGPSDLINAYHSDPGLLYYLETKYHEEFVPVSYMGSENGVSYYFAPEDDPNEIFYARRYRDVNKKRVYEDSYMYWKLLDDLNGYAAEVSGDICPGLTHQILVTGAGGVTDLEADSGLSDFLNMERKFFAQNMSLVVLINPDGAYTKQQFDETVASLNKAWLKESIDHNMPIRLTVAAVTSDLYSQFNKYVLSNAPCSKQTAVSSILTYGLTERTDDEKFDPDRQRLKFYYTCTIKDKEVQDKTPKKYSGTD